MARLQLNKSSLAREAKNLSTYERFLPSLDLKRQQLMAERAKAARALGKTRQAIEDHKTRVGHDLSMLSNQAIDLTDLVKVAVVELGDENVVGTHLPTLKRIDVEVRPYALLARPHWVGAMVAELRVMLELRVRAQIEERRLALLDRAVKTITQRVNLFDKVLIPKTKANIKRIKIYLSDDEMSAVVRSKISKGKHAKAATA